MREAKRIHEIISSGPERLAVAAVLLKLCVHSTPASVRGYSCINARKYIVIGRGRYCVSGEAGVGGAGRLRSVHDHLARLAGKQEA